jgi:hypothetical protein
MKGIEQENVIFSGSTVPTSVLWRKELLAPRSLPDERRTSHDMEQQRLKKEKKKSEETSETSIRIVMGEENWHLVSSVKCS